MYYRARYFRNPSLSEDKKTIRNILGELTPCDKKDWGLRHFQRMQRRRARLSRHRLRRHNPYHARRYNPYRWNPSEAEDRATIKNTLQDLTPCDKKDWGLARYSRRNPNRFGHRRFWRARRSNCLFY